MLTRAELDRSPWFLKEEYPFESRFAALANGRMHYLDEGQGPAVVCVHGTPSWSFEFRHLVGALRDRHRVIVPDHFGFGLSDRPADPAAYGLDRHTARLRELIQGLGLTSYDLVLHDFGGPIGLPLALDAPGRVRRIVVCNSWFWPFSAVDPTFEGKKKYAGSALMRWLYLHWNFSARMMVKLAWGKAGRPLDTRMRKNFLNMFPDPASRAGTLAFLRSTTLDDDYLRELHRKTEKIRNTPALLIWGMADGFVTPAHIPLWRETLNVRSVRELPGIGHFPPTEAPDAFNTGVREFLA